MHTQHGYKTMSKYIKGLFSPKPGPAFHNLNLLVFHAPLFHSNFHCFISPSSFCPSPQQDTKKTNEHSLHFAMLQNAGWVHRKISKKQKGNPILSPSTHGLIPGPRGGTTARLHSQGLAQTPSCMAAASLLPGNSTDQEWSRGPPQSMLALSFMHLHGVVHVPTPTLLLNVNQGRGGGETQRGRVSKISRHVKPAAARYRSRSHPSLACSTLPSWMGAESGCSD